MKNKHKKTEERFIMGRFMVNNNIIKLMKYLKYIWNYYRTS